VDQPGTFLRHSAFRLVLAPNDGSSIFADNATFVPVEGLGNSLLTSFESHNYPDRYLRHHDFEVWFDPIDTDQDHLDATFRLVDRYSGARPAARTARGKTPRGLAAMLPPCTLRVSCGVTRRSGPRRGVQMLARAAGRERC